jgi:hypothetical protein
VRISLARCRAGHAHCCTDEFAVDTFLGAALSIDVTSLLSREPVSWVWSTEGDFFRVTSSYALAGMRRLYLKSSAAVLESRRPAITRLGLRLTEVIRHDLVTHLPEPGAPYDLPRLSTVGFPWHRAIEFFVEDFPAEMGALFRYLVEACDRKSLWDHPELPAAANLFSVADSGADDQVRLAITQHLAKQKSNTSEYGSLRRAVIDVDEARISGSDQASARPPGNPVSSHISQPGRTAGLQTGNSSDEHNLGTRSEPSPYHAINMLPAGGHRSSPGSAAEAIGSDFSSSEAAEPKSGQAPARTEFATVEESDLHVVIDMKAVPPEPSSSSEVAFCDIRSDSGFEAEQRFV